MTPQERPTPAEVTGPKAGPGVWRSRAGRWRRLSAGPLERRHRQNKPGPVAEGDETVVEIEGFRLLVLGIQDQEGRAELASTIGLIDGKSAEPRDRYGWVARQSLGQFHRQFGQRDACGGQRVIAGDFGAQRFEGDLARGCTPAHVLHRLHAEVTVEGGDAAIARCAASWAAATTKSLRLRPWSSAVRFTFFGIGRPPRSCPFIAR